MYPSCPLPRHITALYMIAVVSSIALFSQSITAVGADILVYSEEYHQQIEVVFRDMPSRFGASLPIEGLKGYFVYAEPAQACTPVKPPPAPSSMFNSSGNWILLIMRGSCSFETKVRMAQNSSYDAAIVHNVNSSDLEPMSAANASGIRIPSVFVGENTGFLLKANYAYNRGYYILINDDMPFNINTHLLLPFATVVGICCLIMITFMILKCLQNRRRQRRHRLPSSSLCQIPTSKFHKGDPYETCAVCLEDYVEGEKLRILPCSHAYHSKCIDPWLTRNRRVCPVCKRKVFAQDERISDSDSDSDADDTTPLVRPSAHGTQGGTFVTPSHNLNPFIDSYSSSRNPHSETYYSSTSTSSVSYCDGLTSSGSGDQPAVSGSSEQHNEDHQSKEVGKRTRRHDHNHEDRLTTSSSTSVHTLDVDTSEMAPPHPAVGSEDNTNQATFQCYNMSSGEHSINSEPLDLDFSDDHFEGNRPSGGWGLNFAISGRRVEEHSSVEPAEAAEEAVASTEPNLPAVAVHTPSDFEPDSGDKRSAVV